MTTFFFYDLETSGFNPAYQRIMQFAGQRTDLNLKPIDKPIDVLVKLSEDILPEPEAVLVHGTSPQQTIANGLSEREFSQLLNEQVFIKDTIAIGFNNIRFDDEFIRYLMWRCFYDSYEWHWKDGRSRWDLLDVSRMMRALRPADINWPVDEDGTPTNRLEAMAKANSLKLENAHNALSDIQATIDLARLMKSKQPKLFEFLFGIRDKHSVAKIVSTSDGKPFVYSSGRYPSEFLKTSVAVVLTQHPTDSNAMLIYDLRHDPSEFQDLSVEELKSRIFVSKEDRDKIVPLPVKKMALNKSPAVAPLGTLDGSAQERISLTIETVQKNLTKLKSMSGFAERVYEAYKLIDKLTQRQDTDGQLYDGFLNDKDKREVVKIPRTSIEKLADLHPNFIDERLPVLFLRYKARNAPQTLSDKEQIIWENWRTQKLLEGVDESLTINQFDAKLQQLVKDSNLNSQNRFLLEELQLYVQSIAPTQLFDI